ncbi:glycerol-3-phosphate 1-O-acyltransferase PlsY [Candidatus Zixiibacteriota bacterium]
MILLSGILLLAFLCGSIPTGNLIVKKTAGIDIRDAGSGNIGSTNVKRIAGTKAAITTQMIDILKGTIPVVAAILLAKHIELPINRNILVPITGLATIMGHDFTPFMNFKGGKGVNTTVGSFIIIAAIPTAIAGGMYFIFKLMTRIVSVGSIALAIALPIAVGCFKMPLPIFICSIFAGLLIIIQHKENIGRLLRGEEKPAENNG